jgi:hypothetical protein
LYDGGTSDNLGLAGLHKVLDVVGQHPKWNDARKLVLLIDAYVPAQGKSADTPEPRGTIDYFIDTNFLDAYDTLMSELRRRKIEQMRDRLSLTGGALFPLEFARLNRLTGKPAAKEVYEKVKTIKTSLNIECEEAQALRAAARLLVEDFVEQLKANVTYMNYKDLVQYDPPRPLSMPSQCVKTSEEQQR